MEREKVWDILDPDPTMPEATSSDYSQCCYNTTQAFPKITDYAKLFQEKSQGLWEKWD